MITNAVIFECDKCGKRNIVHRSTYNQWEKDLAKARCHTKYWGLVLPNGFKRYEEDGIDLCERCSNTYEKLMDKACGFVGSRKPRYIESIEHA